MQQPFVSDFAFPKRELTHAAATARNEASFTPDAARGELTRRPSRNDIDGDEFWRQCVPIVFAFAFHLAYDLPFVDDARGASADSTVVIAAEALAFGSLENPSSPPNAPSHARD